MQALPAACPPLPRVAALALLALLALAACLSPHRATAQLTATDWDITNTALERVDSDGDDMNTAVTINLQRCRDLVDADGQQTFTFEITTSRAILANTRYAVKVQQGSSGACLTNTLESTNDPDNCLTTTSASDLTSSPLTETIDFQDLTAAATVDDCDSTGDQTYTVLLIIEQPNVLDGSPEFFNVPYTINYNTQRPTTPTDISLAPGEQTIQVSWTEVDDSDVSNYTIFYAADSLDTSLPPEELRDQSGVAVTSAGSGGSGSISGLNVGTTYAVAVASVDDVGNESLLGTPQTATTEEVDDFWEAFSRDNPDVQGGHCFIATAAYGSYQAPHVRVLRHFRDRVLLTNALGRAFVDAYYRTSPPLADWIAASDTRRHAARTLLLPVYGAAYLWLDGTWYGRALLILLMLVTLLLGFRTLRHLTRRLIDARRASIVASGLILAWAVFQPVTAHAQERLERIESPVNMMLELKVGPTNPTGLGDTYDQYFGSSTSIMFALEYDYQFYRGIGSLGVGASVGTAGADGNGIVTSTGESSVDPTDIGWVAMRVHVVYRFDWLMLEYSVPLVPYGKLGLDYYVWWINDGSGETATNADGDSGTGGTPGWHVTAGIAFLLDWLEEDTANTFDLEWGVNNSYLFAEFVYAAIDGFGSSSRLDLSSNTFLFGLGLEF